MGEVGHAFHTRQQETADQVRGDHQGLLAAHVFGDIAVGDAPGQLLVYPAGLLIGQAKQLVQAVVDDLRIEQQVHEGLLRAAQVLVDQEWFGTASGDRQMFLPSCLGRQICKIEPVGLRPGIVRFDGFGGIEIR